MEVIPLESVGQLAAHLQGLPEIAPYDPDKDSMAAPPPPYATAFTAIAG